jgi:hypothetical protein
MTMMSARKSSPATDSQGYLGLVHACPGQAALEPLADQLLPTSLWRTKSSF